MRHRFHALCPYFAMFPEFFVEKHLVYSKRGDLVFDPFCGRGTTALQSLLLGRRAIASDINPVAFCVSKAKVSAPALGDLIARIHELRSEFRTIESDIYEDSFFTYCFERETLQQLMYLRNELHWRESNLDCFIAAMILGCLHGESHRSPRYFSNRMPRTIATKPNYSINWWNRHGYIAPKRNVFDILVREARFRYESPLPAGEGVVKCCDARSADSYFKEFGGEVSLMITSPPYPDTTHFAEDQWLRLWFLGGEPRPRKISRGDDRHTCLDYYWTFLRESWFGLRNLLSSDQVTIVIRIGGSKLDLDSARQGLSAGLNSGLGREIEVKSAIQSNIVSGQLRSFRPRAPGTKREFDFVFRAAPLTG